MTSRASFLVADDDPGWRVCVGEVLEREGHDVHLAATGGEAIEVVRRVPVHASLLDVQMPGLDGIETALVLRRLRAGLPVVFITGTVSEELRRRGEAVPCFAWLEKPVGRGDLVALVRELVRRFHPGLG